MAAQRVTKPGGHLSASKVASSTLEGPASRPQPTRGAAGALQELQRTVGNRTTVRLLRATPHPTVQRIVFWDESVTPNTIDSITLDRLSGTGGGAHTTSFQLFLETVQNTVINQPYDVAIKRLMALCKDVKDLPGYDDSDTTHNKAFDACEDTYNDAIKIANTSTNIGYFVETLATDYVKLRNAIDYNYLDSGEGDIGGFGEKGNLSAASLAHQEVDWDNIATALGASPPTTAEQEQIDHFNKFIDAAAKLIDTRNVKPPRAARLEPNGFGAGVGLLSSTSRR